MGPTRSAASPTSSPGTTAGRTPLRARIDAGIGFAGSDYASSPAVEQSYAARLRTGSNLQSASLDVDAGATGAYFEDASSRRLAGDGGRAPGRRDHHPHRHPPVLRNAGGNRRESGHHPDPGFLAGLRYQQRSRPAPRRGGIACRVHRRRHPQGVSERALAAHLHRGSGRLRAERSARFAHPDSPRWREYARQRPGLRRARHLQGQQRAQAGHRPPGHRPDLLGGTIAAPSARPVLRGHTEPRGFRRRRNHPLAGKQRTHHSAQRRPVRGHSVQRRGPHRTG